MAVVPKKRASGVTYYVKYEWNGKDVWERSGSDKREAVRLNARRLEQVREGTYQGPALRKSRPTVAEYAAEWLPLRTCRSKKSEAAFFRRYVLSRDWFAGLRVADVAPRHAIQLATELKTAWSERYQRTISPKTVSNLCSTVQSMFRDAFLAELCAANPIVFPKGLLKRKSTKPRKPYELADAVKLLTCKDVHPTARVFAAMAFLTGMRLGEICGRRWRDWDRDVKPLGSLTVRTQYNDQKLKSDEHEEGEHPRTIPVHPDLATILDWWWREGFELVHARRPTRDDFIVPSERGTSHAAKGAYSMWRQALRKAGVGGQTTAVHSTRHTFITTARRNGARKEVIEQITHNAAGEIVDVYTHWDWAPLCEAVLCVRLTPTGDATGDVWECGLTIEPKTSTSIGGPFGIRTARKERNNAKQLGTGREGHTEETPAKAASGAIGATQSAARHHLKRYVLPPWAHEATANLLGLLAGVSQ